MRTFRQYRYFPRKRLSHTYLFPHVCFRCRKSFKKPNREERRICPQCDGSLRALSRNFSAPRSTDTEQWEKVQYLVAHGFVFHAVYEQREDKEHYRVRYSQTLEEAKAFVIQYRDQAIQIEPNTA